MKVLVSASREMLHWTVPNRWIEIEEDRGLPVMIDDRCEGPCNPRISDVHNVCKRFMLAYEL